MRNRRYALKKQYYVITAIFFTILLIAAGSILLGSIHAQAASAGDSFKYYTSVQIQKGDTLWSIADTYMTEDYSNIYDYMNELRDINHITGDEIHSGHYITVPYYSGYYLE